MALFKKKVQQTGAMNFEDAKAKSNHTTPWTSLFDINAAKNIKTPEEAYAVVRCVIKRYDPSEGKTIKHDHFWHLDKDVQQAVLDKLDSKNANTLLNQMIFITNAAFEPWRACELPKEGYAITIKTVVDKLELGAKAHMLQNLIMQGMGGLYKLSPISIDKIMEYSDKNIGDAIKSLTQFYPLYAITSTLGEAVKNIRDKILRNEPIEGV